MEVLKKGAKTMSSLKNDMKKIEEMYDQTQKLRTHYEKALKDATGGFGNDITYDMQTCKVKQGVDALCEAEILLLKAFERFGDACVDTYYVNTNTITTAEQYIQLCAYCKHYQVVSDLQGSQFALTGTWGQVRQLAERCGLELVDKAE